LSESLKILKSVTGLFDETLFCPPKGDGDSSLTGIFWQGFDSSGRAILSGFFKLPFNDGGLQ
jgi:hypothetical protein